MYFPEFARFPVETLKITIVADNYVANFLCSSRQVHGNADAIDIHVVDDIHATDLASLSMGAESRFVAGIKTDPFDEYSYLMINRLFVISGCAPPNLSDNTTDHSGELRQDHSVMNLQDSPDRHPELVDR